MVTQITAINLIPRAITPRVNISQYDTGLRVLKFKVYNDNVPFTFTSGMTVALVGTKPDGKGFSYTGTVENNLPTFDVTEQMSAVAGDVVSELRVYQSGKQIGSGNFIIFVKKGALSNDTDMSESDYAIINDAIEAAFDLDHFSADVQGIVTEAVENIQVKEGQTVIDPTLSVSGAAADAKTTGDMARHFLDALMAETVSGAIATCDDAAGGLPLKKLTAQIEPTQSGTGDPSPDNVRAISGYTGVMVTRTGKNLIDDSKRVSNSSMTTLTIGQTVGHGTPTIFLKAGTYTASVTFKNGATGAGNIKATDPNTGNKRIWEIGSTSGSFTLTQDANCAFYVSNPDGISTDNVATAQVEVGEVATDYEPYNGATYAVNFPTSAGTVYGGTFTVNSDGSGTLTVDRGYIALPAITGTSVSSNVRRWYTAVNNYQTVVACDSLIASNVYISDQVGYVSMSNGANKRIVVTPQWAQDITTIEEFNAALVNHPINIVVPLATPTTYALSAVQVVHMLNGVNNIWTDAAGTLMAEYYANTALYVDKKIAELQALILENQ